MADLRIDIASEFTGKKAFANASKATNTLDRSVAKLGRTLALTFGAAAIANFGKNAAKAFIEDQKQADRLANAVKNLGLELSNPAIASYIDKLTLASGVSDSQLRPAFQALLTTTGDLVGSQKLLSQAIDISAGSGVDLITVAQDLSNAYIGKTKALTKYNLGLTTAELKTAKFVDIQKKLNDLYKGANEAYLQTYAGRLDAITTAANEAKEAIGGALVDAFMTLTNSVTTEDLVGHITGATDALIGFIDRFALSVQLVKALAPHGILGFMFGSPDPKKVQDDISKAWKDFNDKKLRRSNKAVWAGIKTPAQTAQEKAAAAAAAKRQRELIAAQNKQTAELKKQAALKKDSSIFDMQQIELIAALKGKLSEDDRRRAELQLALLNENVTEADRLTKQILMAQDATGNLYKYFLQTPDAKNPFGYLDKWLADFQTKLNALQFPNPSSGAGGSVITTIIPKTDYSGFAFPTTTPSTSGSASQFGSGTPWAQAVAAFAAEAVSVPSMDMATSQFGSGTPWAQAAASSIYVQIDGKTIATANQSQSLSGIPSNVSRVNGMFTG